jgi:hypothetical protein
MYGNTSAAGGMMATGLIAASSGWTIAGLGLLACAALTVGFMAASRVTRRNRGS